MVTAGTYLKKPLFDSPERLTLLCETLLKLAETYSWELQAWAVFSNHYHFVALAPVQPGTLRIFIRHLHSVTARALNKLDPSNRRRVWFEYWETHLSYQKSYYARLNYVHRNAVHHGLARAPSAYPWCSAAWLERNANQTFYRTILSFPSDRLSLSDDYTVAPTT
jgi:putative transposase